VLVQIALQGKRLVAALAVEVFESRVGLHVSSQVGPVCKGLSTMGATVGLVPRVAPHVPLQQPRPREGLAADVALVVEVVGEHVHAEGRHAHVHLVADLALLRVPRVERPVGLAVSGQVRGCCIVLPAFGTGILRLRLLGGYWHFF